MSNPSSGNDSGSEIILVTLVVVSILVLTYLFNAYIDYFVNAWRYIRIAEISLFAWIPDWFPVYGSLELGEALQFLKDTPASEINSETIEDFDNHYAKYFSWIHAVILGAFAYRILKSSLKSSKKYDAEELLKRQSEYFPHLQEFVDVNPIELDLEYIRDNDGAERHAMQLTPIQFCTIVPPMGLESQAENVKTDKVIPIWSEHFGFDVDLCERSLLTQLGDPYKGPSKFNDTEKQLYNFLLKKMPINETELIEQGIEILDCIKNKKVPAIKGLHHKELLRELVALVKSIENPNRVQIKMAIVRRLSDSDFKALVKKCVAEQDMSLHGFNHTALMSMIKKARLTGVVAPLEVRNMLKGENRVLWYCIQNVGRQSVFPEAAGAFCHWQIEEAIGIPLEKGDVSIAAKELRKYMESYAEKLKDLK